MKACAARRGLHAAVLCLYARLLGCVTDNACTAFSATDPANAAHLTVSGLQRCSGDLLVDRGTCPIGLLPPPPTNTSCRAATQPRKLPSEPRELSPESRELPSAASASSEQQAHFIVRFTLYRHAAEWKELLAPLLAPSHGAYRWVNRHNAAAAHPTDFGLIVTEDGSLEDLQGLLEGYGDVRSVHADRRITRSMLWAPPDSNADEPADSSGGSRRHHSDSVRKAPGRLRTRPTFGLDDDFDAAVLLAAAAGNITDSAQRRLLAAGMPSVTRLLGAEQLWEAGFTGAGVRMGIFDTGIRSDHPHVKKIRERTNWTHEPTLEDGLGHGTYVAGVVAGKDAGCPGFAPDVELHTFRVFTNDQVSYTSWFLDAFNYAVATRMHVINLSIGGPDYLDQPFVEKVWEITSNGIIMVSAIGNDGPLYGTLNNPADQNDVIGVGGIDFHDQVAGFSSRGMSTWELPRGYGRAKPDVMAHGHNVLGSRIKGGCRPLSGTSVASPVVAGAVCLLASVVPEVVRWSVLNPASMKQALVEGATRLPGANTYEQGQGKLNLLASRDILQSYTPHASLLPAALDFTDCPFMWPHCRTPLYARAVPLIFNATVLNGLGLVGYFEGEPTFTPADEGGRQLAVSMTHSDVLWPWSGFLAVFVRVRDEADAYEGEANGNITFTIRSPPALGETEPRTSTVVVPLKARIMPTPPRGKRILWDQFHNLKYPPAYLPRDNLAVRNDILDWHGDHPHTNFHAMFDALRDAGYFLEILGSPYTCFDAQQYGALLLVDLEEEYYPEEIAKLTEDVRGLGLGLVVFGEWYNAGAMSKMGFFDDNTRSWWTPATGGANIPALNDLLSPFGVAFGDHILEGSVTLGARDVVHYASGTNIAAFPAGGRLMSALLHDKSVTDYTVLKQVQAHFPVLGIAPVDRGRVALYGDSNCLDSSHQRNHCHSLLLHLLDWATGGPPPAVLPDDTTLVSPLAPAANESLPQRPQAFNFTTVSHVLQEPLQCYDNAPQRRGGGRAEAAGQRSERAVDDRRAGSGGVEHEVGNGVAEDTASRGGAAASGAEQAAGGEVARGGAAGSAGMPADGGSDRRNEGGGGGARAELPGQPTAAGGQHAQQAGGHKEEAGHPHPLRPRVPSTAAGAARGNESSVQHEDAGVLHGGVVGGGGSGIHDYIAFKEPPHHALDRQMRWEVQTTQLVLVYSLVAVACLALLSYVARRLRRPRQLRGKPLPTSPGRVGPHSV